MLQVIHIRRAGDFFNTLLGLAGIPAGIVLTKALFADLLAPVYQNLKTFVVKMANEFQEAAEVEAPDIDPAEEAEEPLEDASTEVESVEGSLAEEGAEYLAVNWSSVGLEAAGLGAVAAIPMIIGFLGHKMSNSLEIHNLTGVDLAWSIDSQIHGQTSVAPNQSSGAQTISAMDYNTDMWGDRTTVKVAYSLDMQFINASDLGSIGYVMTLTPGDGSTPIRLMVSVPWGDQNVIWAGASTDDAQTLYDTYSADDSPSHGQTSWSATVGAYQVTVSITALSGTTEGQYFYGTLVVVEPVGG